MTARAGRFDAGLIDPGPGDAKKGSRIGAVRTLSFVLGADVAKWKNQAWIASASVYETWITSPDPSTSPPTGRAGTFITHVPLVN